MQNQADVTWRAFGLTWAYAVCTTCNNGVQLSLQEDIRRTLPSSARYLYLHKPGGDCASTAVVLLPHTSLAAQFAVEGHF